MFNTRAFSFISKGIKLQYRFLSTSVKWAEVIETKRKNCRVPSPPSKQFDFYFQML